MARELLEEKLDETEQEFKNSDSRIKDNDFYFPSFKLSFNYDSFELPSSCSESVYSHFESMLDGGFD